MSTIENNSKSFCLLISSASKKVPLVLAAKSAVSRIGLDIKVIAGDVSSTALSFYVADDFWVMPMTQENNLEKIIAGCKERNIRMILPTRDGELIFWAKHALRMKNIGIEVIISSIEAIETCIDKLAFAKFGCSNKLPIIETSRNIDDLKTTNYVVKERFGAGSRGIGINLNYQAAKEYALTLKHPLFQPFIHGVEFSADAWLDSSNCVKAIVLRKRDLVINGESQVTTTFTNRNIETQIKHLLEKLQPRGPVVLQGIINRRNKLQVIECNARFGGASNAGIAAGLDSLYWSIFEATGNNPALLSFKRINGELRQIRIPTDIYDYGSNF